MCTDFLFKYSIVNFLLRLLCFYCFCMEWYCKNKKKRTFSSWFIMLPNRLTAKWIPVFGGPYHVALGRTVHGGEGSLALAHWIIPSKEDLILCLELWWRILVRARVPSRSPVTSEPGHTWWRVPSRLRVEARGSRLDTHSAAEVGGRAFPVSWDRPGLCSLPWSRVSIRFWRDTLTTAYLP